MKTAIAIKSASACTLTKEEKKLIKVFKDTLCKNYMLALNQVEKEVLESNSLSFLGIRMAIATQAFSNKTFSENIKAFKTTGN